MSGSTSMSSSEVALRSMSPPVEVTAAEPLTVTTALALVMMSAK
jgi:hypothetical protein